MGYCVSISNCLEIKVTIFQEIAKIFPGCLLFFFFHYEAKLCTGLAHNFEFVEIWNPKT